jgi:hypothetical protein
MTGDDMVVVEVAKLVGLSKLIFKSRAKVNGNGNDNTPKVVTMRLETFLEQHVAPSHYNQSSTQNSSRVTH